MHLKHLSININQFLLKKRIRNEFVIRFLLKFGVLIDKIFIEYINTRARRSRDHIVPKFLLRKFKIGLPHCNNCLFVFEKEAAGVSLKPKSISKEIGFIENFYDFRDKNGYLSDFIDQKVYRSIESNVSIVLNDFENKLRTNLTYFEELAVYNFISYQVTRTLYFRKCIETYIHILLETKVILKEDLNNDEVIEKILLNKFNIPLEVLISWKSIINPTLLEGEKAVGMMTSICLKMTDEIARSIWDINNIQLIKAEQGDILISDNPVIFWDLNEGVDTFLQWWDLKSKNLFLPISDNQLLLITKSIPKNKIENDIELSKPFIDLNNYGQYLTSCLGVYGKDRKKLVEYITKFSNKNVS